jgi:mRNA interferase YafQ
MKYTVKPTIRFRKDYKLMEKRNFDMSLLDEIIIKLAQGIPKPLFTDT